MRQQLLHQTDPRTARASRAATIVFLLVFAAWLAYFGVTAPWDLSGKGVDAAEFFGRFFGIVVLIAAILSPLAIAAAAERRRA